MRLITTCRHCGNAHPIAGAKLAGWKLGPVPSLDECAKCADWDNQ